MLVARAITVFLPFAFGLKAKLSVIGEDAVVPVAPLIPDAHITEAIIDAAVESDVGPPIAGMPDICSAI